MSAQNFTLLAERKINEYEANTQVFRHDPTHAQIISIQCPDENKVFGVTFLTPPEDSTGLPHILEHSVLCGSKNYPVKEPFVELLKGSLQTFLNAFTYPDRTCYPVAGTNEKDFHNLIRVYLDAVLRPNITRAIFAQEGWHFVPKEDYLLRGVVYNEMKGAYSSPDTLLYSEERKLLFEGTPIGLDSGGDPRQIPNLTYEQFKNFHQTHYHPGNARIYFYGNDDPKARLRLIEEALGGFGPPVKKVGPPALKQPFAAPKRATRPFCAAPEEKRGQAIVSWLLPETLDLDLVLGMSILEHILIGLPSSTLRKKLSDSGLGEDFAGVGLEDELRQMYFSVGLKGILPENVPAMEDIIRSCLKEIHEKGPDPLDVEAAVNSLEFSLRENNTGSFPQGLALMLRLMPRWLYTSDPLKALDVLAFEKPIAKLKENLLPEKKFLEDLLKTCFLENPSRLHLSLAPDPELEERNRLAEQEFIEKARNNMSDADKVQIEKLAEEVRLFQETPDSPQDLAKIPRLTIKDLNKSEKKPPTQIQDLHGYKIYTNCLPSAGIIYLHLAFPLDSLPSSMVYLIPIFGRAMLETGTAKEDFVSLNRRIARKTGGIFRSNLLSGVFGFDPSKQIEARMTFKGKVTVQNAPELLNVLRDILTSARLEDKERLRQILAESKARAESRIIPRGNALASSRLRTGQTLTGWADEHMSGISSFFRLRELSQDFDSRWPELGQSLSSMRSLILSGKPIVCLTTDDKALQEFLPALEDFLLETASEPTSSKDPSQQLEPWQIDDLPVSQAFVIPAGVNYVAKGTNLFATGYAYHGSALAAIRYLRTAHLWDKVRVRGGAYGASVSLERLSGSLIFASYRDPNIRTTLEAFDESGVFLTRAEIPEAEIEKSVIGAIGDLDTHMLAETRGYVGMLRELSKDTLEIRQKMRDELLSTTREDFKRLGEAMLAATKMGKIAVFGSEAAMLKDAEFLGNPEIVKTL